jgi:hypothetical protein
MRNRSTIVDYQKQRLQQLFFPDGIAFEENDLVETP